MLEKFLNDSSMGMRLLRTIIQGVLAVAVVSVSAVVGMFDLTPEMASIVTALIMAVLTPIMAAIKTGNPEDAVEEKDENGQS